MMRRYYPYAEFVGDLKKLTQKIDQPFDSILGIARGGLSMAQMLGEHYNLREVYALNTIGYEAEKKNSTVAVFNIPKLLEAKHVLVVDDIVDSGDTLVEVLKTLKQHYPEVTFFTASLFYKKTAKMTPTWFAQEATEWIDFFWSEDLK